MCEPKRLGDEETGKGEIEAAEQQAEGIAKP
jgi:hypothetical protein